MKILAFDIFSLLPAAEGDNLGTKPVFLEVSDGLPPEVQSLHSTFEKMAQGGLMKYYHVVVQIPETPDEIPFVEIMPIEYSQDGIEPPPF